MLGDGSQAIPLGSQTRPGQARVPYIYLLPTSVPTLPWYRPPTSYLLVPSTDLRKTENQGNTSSSRYILPLYMQSLCTSSTVFAIKVVNLRLARNFPNTFRPQPCIHSCCKANLITGGRMRGIVDTEGTIREEQIHRYGRSR